MATVTAPGHTHKGREDRLSLIRVGKSARDYLTEGGSRRRRAGTVVEFPTSVFAPMGKINGGSAAKNRISRSEKLQPVALRPDTEPGVFHCGTYRVTYDTIRHNGVVIEGYWFEIIVGRIGQSPAHQAQHGWTHVTGPETRVRAILRQLPQGITRPAETAEMLRVHAKRAVRRADDAYAELMTSVTGLVNSIAHQKFLPHVAASLASADEVQAAGLPHIANAIDLYASPNRPSHSFVHHVQINATRDMGRALNTYEAEKQEPKTQRNLVYAAIDRLGGIDDPIEIAKLINRDKAAKALRKADRDATPSEIKALLKEMIRNDEIKEWITPERVQTLLSTPAHRTVSIDAPLGDSDSDSTYADVHLPQHHDELDDLDVADGDTMVNVLRTLLAGHPELTHEHFGDFLHRMGLTTGTDDVAHPRAVPANGALGKVLRTLLEPFKKPGEHWAVAADREKCRKRAAALLTKDGLVRDVDDIMQVWAQYTNGRSETA